MSERMLEAGIDWDFQTFDEYLKLVEHAGTVLNFGCYVGHSPVRLFVMGDEGYEREASPEEIEAMRVVVADAMRSGALGFASSFSANHRGDRGLPVPSRNGTVEEFVRIASVLGELDAGVVCDAPGVPVSYLDSYELQPRIGRPLMWTPMLSSYPVKDHRTMLAQHAEGRANGADVYVQVTCLPLKVQIQMTNPYYFRTARRSSSSSPASRCRSSPATTPTRNGAPRPARCPTASPPLTGRSSCSRSRRRTRSSSGAASRRSPPSGRAPRSTSCATSHSPKTSRPDSSRCSATTTAAPSPT